MSEQHPPPPGDHVEQIIVDNLGGETSVKVGEPFDPSKFQAETARQLAIWFILMLGISIALHYAAVVLIGIFAKEAAKDLIERLERIFNSWLPVISSLVSSVAAFYFAKAGEKKSDAPE